jgi:hypothetical protein
MDFSRLTRVQLALSICLKAVDKAHRFAIKDCEFFYNDKGEL